MRFQQLKHNSNTILRKKLYKSGKNWVVKSSLSLAGGLILFGATQIINVSADAVSDQQTTQNVDTNSNFSHSVSNTTETNSDSVQQPNENESQNITVNNNQSNNNVPQPSIRYKEQANTAVAQASAQTPTTSTQQPTTNQVTNTAVAPTIPANASHLGTSSYYVDDNSVLHITAGEFTQTEYNALEVDKNTSIFNSMNYNKISFDGKVIAHGSLNNFFKDSTATSIENLENLDTSDVTDFSGMFNGLLNIKDLDVSSFDTSKATNMAAMFEYFGTNNNGNVNIKGLENFNTSKVKNMSNMFNGCTGITSLSNIASWDVSAVSDFSFMFIKDISLTDLDLSNWNVNNASTMYMMINSCTALVNLKLPKLDNPNNSELNMSYMLAADDKLSSLDFSEFNVPTTSDRSQMLNGDTHLTKLVLNNKVNLDGTGLSLDAIYNGWNNVGSGTDEKPDSTLGLYDSTQMMTTYSNNNGLDETWVVDTKKLINYQIKYVDYDTGEDINANDDIIGQTYENHLLNIKTLNQRGISLIGYDTGSLYYGSDNKKYDQYTDLNITTPISGTPEADNLVYTVKVKKSNITINVADVANPVVLPIGDSTPVTSNKDFEKLNSTKQLDLDKTTFTVVIGENASISSSITQLFEILNKGAEEPITPETNVKDLSLQLLSLTHMLVRGFVITPGVLTINPVYIPGQDSDSGNNSGSTTVDRTVKNVHQTSATFADRPVVQLYDFNGNAIKGKTLGVNTDWVNDQEMTLNDQVYYRVSTDEWVKSSDVYVYVEHISKIRTYKENNVQLKNAHLDNTQVIDPSTDWKTDRYAIFDGKEYYRISTNEFAPSDKVYEYQDSDKNVYLERIVPMYDERGNNLGRGLKSGTEYKTDRLIKIGDESYYRVSTNEFVKNTDVI